MKRLLGYLFLILGLILINQKIEASQSNELKLKKIKINTKDQEFYKIGNDIRGRVEGMEWINRFYGYTEDNKLKGLIEIFTFDNSGGTRGFEGYVNKWFRGVAFQNNSESGCENINKIFFKKIDLKINVACLSVRKIKADELSSPNFNKAEYVPFIMRKKIIMKFIKKKQVLIPDEMIRAEHYFYQGGKINWILFSSAMGVNSEEYISKFINQTVQNHQNFEEQLRLNEMVRFDFTEKLKITKETKEKPEKKEKKKIEKKIKKKITQTDNSNDIVQQIIDLKELYDSGALTEEEFNKAKKKLLNQ